MKLNHIIQNITLDRHRKLPILRVQLVKENISFTKEKLNVIRRAVQRQTLERTQASSEGRDGWKDTNTRELKQKIDLTFDLGFSPTVPVALSMPHSAADWKIKSSLEFLLSSSRQRWSWAYHLQPWKSLKLPCLQYLWGYETAISYHQLKEMLIRSKEFFFFFCWCMG